MNTKHTEGPMEVRGSRKTALYIGGRYIADTDSGKPHEMPEHIRAINQANAERLALAWNLLTELPALLPEPTKLRIIASHFDLKDLITGDTQSEVQDDLRQWTRNIESILSKATNPNAGAVQAHPKGRW